MFARERSRNYLTAKRRKKSSSLCLYNGALGQQSNRADIVKVTIRKVYGFRTFRIAELTLLHVPGKLPEPNMNHEFYWGSYFQAM
jgi:hypothetical protein